MEEINHPDHWYHLLNTNDIRFLENLKESLKRTVPWNRYNSKITTQPKNNNLKDMIDSSFGNNNRMFTISSKNDDDGSARNSSVKYYIPLIEKTMILMYQLTINHFLINI